MLVSHGAFLGILIAELLGLDARHAFAVGLAGPSMPNTGTALLTLKGAGVTFAPIPRPHLHCTLRLAADRLVLVVQLAQVGGIGNVEHLEGVAARLAPRL